MAFPWPKRHPALYTFGIREALRATLALFSRLEFGGVTGDCLSRLSLVRKVKPALLIIDSRLLEDEIAMLLRQVKQRLQISCRVLAAAARQHQTLLAPGADAVILRSEPTERPGEALDTIRL